MIDGIVDLDRKWLVADPEAIPMHVVYTEEQILREYWPWWHKKMQELDRQHLVSPRNCIVDWITIHYAQRVR